MMNITKWFDNAVMINRDPNWYAKIDDSSADACKSSLESFFSAYDGKITDVCLCVFEQTALIPSKAFMWRGEKYLQKTENGHDVDYSADRDVRALYRCFAEYNVDAVQIFIDRVKEKGIRPWITLRMNDVHFGAEETSVLHSDMFYEESAAGHIIGEKYGYYGHCFDFKYPRYRTALLGFIGEILDKYDFFGLELDFMREIRCFDYLENDNCHQIMSEYIREIRKLVDAAEKRVGHEIKLSIRTCAYPSDALIFGFDVKTLCDEGTIDAVIPSPRWRPTESYIPIAEWRRLLGDRIGILGGIESLNFEWSANTAYNSKAYAAAFYAQGADGIYFNNHENPTERNMESWEINRDNCLKGHREFVVLYSDCFAYSNVRYKPLPMTFNGGGRLPLMVGLVKPCDSVRIIVDFEGDEPPLVRVGKGKPVPPSVTEPYYHRPLRSTGEMVKVTLNTPLEYDVSGISTDNELDIVFVGKGTVHYVNVIIDSI